MQFLLLILPTSVDAITKNQSTSYVRVGITSATADKPTSATPGNVLVAELALTLSPAANITPPAGWTLACKAGTTSGRLLTKAIYTHEVAQNEPTTYTWAFPSTGGTLSITDFSDVDGTNPIENCQSSTATNTTTITAPATSASHVGEYMISSFARSGHGSLSEAANSSEFYDISTVIDSRRAVSASANYSITDTAGVVAAKTATGSASSASVVGLQYGLVPATSEEPPQNNVLFSDNFDGDNGLITNEFTHWNPTNSQAVISPAWSMTSGSVFRQNNSAWTGAPDDCTTSPAGPNATSSNCTHSNVFRLNTKQSFSGSTKVSVALRQNTDIHSSTCSSTGTCYYGTHLWLRHKSQYDLYYASVQRADGKVVLKRKVPCGSDNKGTYFQLGSYTAHDWNVNQWHHYSVTSQTNSDGSVTIKLYDTGASTTTPVLSATDTGGTNPNWSPSCTTPGAYSTAAYPPITAPGTVGVRGDYANFSIDDFTVTEF